MRRVDVGSKSRLSASRFSVTELSRRYALLFGVGFVPLFFLRNVVDPINIPKLGLLFAVVSIAVALRLIDVVTKGSKPDVGAVWIPAAAVVGALTWGWIFSPFKGWALMGDYPRYLGLLPYLVTALLAVAIADAFRRDTFPLAWAFVAAGAVAGAYAVIQVLGLDPLSWSSRGSVTNEATSTLGNSNFTGGFLAMSLPVAGGLLIFDQRRRLLVGASAAAIAAGLLVSGSEGGFAAALAGLAVAGGVWLSRRSFRLAGLIAAGLIALFMVGLVGFGVFARESVPETVKRRADWWDAAFTMTLGSPLFGRGPNSFALEHPRHRDVDDVREAGFVAEPDPHSLPLSLSSAAGVVGLAAFGLLAGWLVVMILRAEGPLSAGFAGGGVAYLVQALVSIDTPALRTTGWCLLGALAAAAGGRAMGDSSHLIRVKGKAKGRNARPARSPLLRIWIVPVVVLAGFTTWSGVRLIAADASFRAAGASSSQGGSFDEIRSQYDAAITANDEPVYRQAYASFVGGVAPGVAAQGGHEEAFRLATDATKILEFTEDLPDVEAILTLARLNREWVGFDDAAGAHALDLYEEASRLDPANYLLETEAGLTALGLGLNDRARSFFAGAIETAPDHAPAWGGLALAQARLEEAGAAETVARALVLDPVDPNAVEAQAILAE